uniref:Uncharacterized protein n=1 Tax=Branchiostoma floridae TaxID=7739 RepID=C3ZAQ1_BRAFL|eukprot:XP_002594443.1 hypothetical protein BRAFLDRAFT_72170 [Branchiostoma floridae]
MAWTINPSAHEQEAWTVMKPFRRPNWEESEYTFTREQLPTNTTFCFSCGRPFSATTKHLHVRARRSMVVHPNGGRCFACGSRKGALETYGIVRWGQGWRAVEAHTVSYTVVHADGEQTPAVYQEETLWEDDTYLPGDEQQFSTLVRLFEQLHCSKDTTQVDDAIDSILDWISNEEEERGTDQGLGREIRKVYGPLMTENERGEVVVYK